MCEASILGMNGRVKYEANLQVADCVVVVIRDWNQWLGVGDFGIRRIDAPDDWVRQEVALAIQDNKQMFPVFVGDEKNLQPPPADCLPTELQPLLQKQRIHLGKNSWDHDILRLIHSVYPERSISDSAPGNNSGDVGRRIKQNFLRKCEAVLAQYSQKCNSEWNRIRPARFIEPHSGRETRQAIAGP